MFQKSIDNAALPVIWRKAAVSPIYKGGPRDEVNNYRPVSITSILCKCLEHIICSNIWRHIEQNDLLSDRQQGFRKGFSTTTQLLHVVHHATEALDKEDDYHIISFDFSKAFDKVRHEGIEVEDKAQDIISSFLKGRNLSVALGRKASGEFSIHDGVPHGSIQGIQFIFILDQ